MEKGIAEKETTHLELSKTESLFSAFVSSFQYKNM